MRAGGDRSVSKAAKIMTQDEVYDRLRPRAEPLDGVFDPSCQVENDLVWSVLRVVDTGVKGFFTAEEIRAAEDLVDRYIRDMDESGVSMDDASQRHKILRQIVDRDTRSFEAGFHSLLNYFDRAGLACGGSKGGVIQFGFYNDSTIPSLVVRRMHDLGTREIMPGIEMFAFREEQRSMSFTLFARLLYDRILATKMEDVADTATTLRNPMYPVVEDGVLKVEVYHHLESGVIRFLGKTIVPEGDMRAIFRDHLGCDGESPLPPRPTEFRPSKSSA